MRDVSPEELAGADGSDASRPMLISIRGTVYDVTKGKDFYGPGGECTRSGSGGNEGGASAVWRRCSMGGRGSEAHLQQAARVRWRSALS